MVDTKTVYNNVFGGTLRQIKDDYTQQVKDYEDNWDELDADEKSHHDLLSKELKKVTEIYNEHYVH